MSMMNFVREDLRTAVAGGAATVDVLRESCILVTGGTGFVGKWLAELVAFLNDEHGFNIRLLLLSRNPHTLDVDAPHLLCRKDISMVAKDVRSIMDIPEDVEWIIHAAGTPDNRIHASDPLRVMQVIAHGTGAVLEAASRLPRLQRVLNISSGLVYGPQPLSVSNVAETVFSGINCASVQTIYAEANRFGESICAAYRNLQRLPIVTARPFAFIGPYQHLDRPWAINNFIRDSLMGGPIRILGDGGTVRSYMYAADMAWWMLSILARGGSGTIYNVGSPSGITLKTLAEKILRITGDSQPIQVNLSHDFSAKRSIFVPDVSLAEKAFGLGLTMDIDTAIRRTIHWHREFTTLK